MAREAFVHERVIGTDKFQDAAVFANDVVEEEFSLFFHGSTQWLVEFRIFFAGRGGGAEVANLEPLPGEVVHEGAGPRVFEHAFNLGIEILAKRAAPSLSEEFIVGHAAPKEVGKARGQSEFVNGMDRTGVVRIGLNFTTK